MLEGHVVGISDGDSLTIIDDDKKEHTIRIGGIDAPERNEPFWSAAKKNLSRLAFN